jgi:hypothetical protein
MPALCRAVECVAPLASLRNRAYLAGMTPVFDIADHDRLPWRFAALTRSVLARLA